MKKAVVILFLLVSALSYAQQDPLYNQYMFNPLVVNPAYAGSRESVSAVLLHRTQWLGVQGAPSTQTLSVHSPLMDGKIGIGGTIIRDQFGPTTSTGLMGSYAYRIFMGEAKLAFGLRTSVYNYQFDGAEIEYKETGETAVINSTEWVPSFDFGVRYYNRTMYAGITFLYLNNPQLDYSSGGNDGSINDGAGPSIARHVNITLGKAFEYSKDIVFKPSLLAKLSDKGNSILDINFSALYKDALWVGFSYRTSQSLILIAEYNISDRFRAGYSYDIPMSRLIKTTSGSHEIFIGFDFITHKSKPRMVSPRVYF
jgi:type IX secretion system PorP/SprF family membrane protein